MFLGVTPLTYTVLDILWNNGVVVKVQDSQSRAPVGGPEIYLAFRPSKVNQMSTRNLGKLSGSN